MTTQDDPAKLDPALPGWWAFWDEYAERNRRPWAGVSQGDMPDPNVDPELHQLARDDFGFRDAGRRDNEPPGMLEARLFLKWPGSPRSKTEALSMKRRKLTEIEVVGPDASAIGWEAAPAMRALRLLHVYATMDPGGAHFALARAVVSAKKEGNDATDDEVDRLARALAQHAQKLARELGWDGPGLAERLPLWTAEELGYGSEDERLQLFYGRRVDAKAIGLDGSLDLVADFLARIGENGQRLAERYRGETDPSLWVRPDGPKGRPDAPTRSPVMWSLAVVVWCDIVAPGLLAEAKRRPPALVRAFAADQILPAMSRQLTLPGIGRNELKDRKGRTVALLDGDMTLVAPGLDKLRTVTGQRLVNLAASTIALQEELGEQYPNIITIEGGLSGLAAALQHDKGDTKTLQELLEAGYALCWKTASGYGEGWWTYRITRGGPGRPGLVVLTLADVWRPGYVYALEGNAPKDREGRRMIPVLREEPPVGTLNPKHQGQGWVAYRRVMVELVDQAERLYENGGAKLDDKAWRRIQDASELSTSVLASVKEAFFQGDGERPPLLKDAGKGLITLADVHDLELKFIIEGGELRVTGRESGRKSQEAKARARAKRSRKGNTPG